MAVLLIPFELWSTPFVFCADEVSFLRYLSVFRGVSIAKSAGHNQDQRLMLKVNHVIFLHGHHLHKAKKQTNKPINENLIHVKDHYHKDYF